MKTLALDLGTHTGFAVHANTITSSGSILFKRYKGCKSKPADHMGKVILDFHKWLRNQIIEGKYDCIIYEAVYRWSSSDAAKAYGAFRGILMLNAAAYGIDVFAYSPTAIKKHFTGKGNANKEAMLKEGRKRYPHHFIKDDNEADALALLSLHLETLALATK